MDFFRRRNAAGPSASDPQTRSSHEFQARQTPARPRHSVAVSSISEHPSRNPFKNNDLNRQTGLPSSRSYAQFSKYPPAAHYPSQPRSISASYSSRSQPTGVPRSSTFRLHGRGPADLSAMSPEKPKSRIQKIKTKIVDRFDFSHVMDYPGDKWTEMWEYFDLMDFDEMGYTLGFGLNGLHLTIRVIAAIEKARRNLIQSRSSRIGQATNQFVNDRLNEARQLAKRKYSLSWLDIMYLLSLMMCFYSCYNAYKLFSSRKSYRMHIREDPVNSPNATVVQSPTAPEAEAAIWSQTFLSLLRRLSSLLIGWPNPGSGNIPKPSQVHQLDMWHPTEVRLRIFTVYPPPQAFLVHFASLSENCMNWTLLMIATMTQTYWIVRFYSQLVKDKEIVQAEVMHEYNAKFVYPKVFPHTREACTMTNSAEFIRREDWLTY